MAAPNDSRPFGKLDDDEFDDLLETELDDSETLLKLLREASARGYEGEGVEAVLDRYLELAIDDVYEKYRDAFELFFNGVALEYFADDARKYLTILESRADDEDDTNEDEDDEDEGEDEGSTPTATRSPIMAKTRFPVAEYYAEHVVDGITLSRKGTWWSALLLIRDPKTQVPFLNLYRWEQVDGTWKNRKSFVIRDQQAVDKIISALNEFRARLPPT
jgi:hypothetical protein